MSNEQWTILIAVASLLITLLTALGVLPIKLKEPTGTKMPLGRRMKVLIALNVLAILLAGYGFYRARPYKWAWKGNDTSKFVHVADRYFKNQVVPLDGISYRHCVFDNVTLSYNGTGPLDLRDNTFIGYINNDTENPAVRWTVALVVGTVKMPVKVDLLDASGHPIDYIAPPIWITPTPSPR